MSNLLTLAMIVKDEADTARRTLESVLPFVDRWVIADTGSSDKTKAVIRRAAQWVPGKIIDIDFVDFSSARNAALAACGTETKYILMLDAEDVLVGGEALREWLMGAQHMNPPTDLYKLLVRSGHSRWSSARVCRSDSACRYVGKVHEMMVTADGSSPACVLNNGCTWIVHDRSPRSDQRTVARHVRDIDLLMDDAKTDPRAAFYLARSMATIGMNTEAIVAFESRIAMGGWHEEVCCSMMHLAWLKEKAGCPWSESLDLYLRAHHVAPHRSESIYEIARHYNEEKQYALSAVFARRGIDIPAPGKNALFVDEDVYAWKMFDAYATAAYWVEDYETGESCARKAYAARPDDTRLRDNVAAYENRERP